MLCIYLLLWSHTSRYTLDGVCSVPALRFRIHMQTELRQDEPGANARLDLLSLSPALGGTRSTKEKKKTSRVAGAVGRVSCVKREGKKHNAEMCEERDRMDGVRGTRCRSIGLHRRGRRPGQRIHRIYWSYRLVLGTTTFKKEEEWGIGSLLCGASAKL